MFAVALELVLGSELTLDLEQPVMKVVASDKSASSKNPGICFIRLEPSHGNCSKFSALFSRYERRFTATNERTEVTGKQCGDGSSG